MFITVFDVKYNNWDDRMILVIRISRNQAEHQNFFRFNYLFMIVLCFNYNQTCSQHAEPTR